METTYMPGATPDGSLMNPDIALVHLSTTPCNTIPANLPDNRMLQTGDVVSAAGFGVGNGHADIPEQIHLRILPQTKDALVSLYQGEDRSWTNMIAQDFAKYSSRYLFALDADDYGSICNGDSGGPIFKESNGIVSLVGENGAYIVHPTKGIPACNGAYIQLFTPLAPYLGWIRSQIEIWGK
jgi:secreted trypsin-like serine protease